MSDAILIAILGSGVVSALISGLFAIGMKRMERKWSKGDKLTEIEKRLKKTEVDSVRLQILLLMSDYPDDTQEILRVAEHYFKDLKGNWYMTTMFNKWLVDHDIAEPDWFRREEAS